ncbi:DUF1302 domain-containing protein [Pseudoalteromonas sp. OOF1S-7]|uniref:DUF1302 domain-containing protein n=1 Tax=Pseudoalteromonas sp. OOF1S-7 TaxID=2917757 RepID=UPI001EF72734|nr:DUF1302 domain-containing protein [Pseudoalteromonas sp. OOF1S-7]MCG7534603.1 DUF1302 domain-containing protein [Pseudoalteromonas sp. OOF1S-7]
MLLKEYRYLMAFLFLFCCFESLANEVDDEFSEWDEFESAEEQNDLELYGFLEFLGSRFLDPEDRYSYKDYGIYTARVSGDFTFDESLFKLKADVSYNDRFQETDFELREAYYQKYVLDNLQVKLGRQVISWGTGDQVFLNDLFPKNWRALLLSQDIDYLKKPINALRLDGGFSYFNLDLVAIESFEPDDYINGEYFSYFNSEKSDVVGENDILHAEVNDKREYAARIYGNQGSVEWSLYFHDGYLKQPFGTELSTSERFFPALNSFGASIRAPLFGGLANIEVSDYSVSDTENQNKIHMINSQLRALAGYEFEIFPEVNFATQLYVEKDSGSEVIDRLGLDIDKTRSQVSFKLSFGGLNDEYSGYIFIQASPNQDDAYLQGNLQVRVNDRLRGVLGFNVFDGERNNTKFSQFDYNDNIYLRVRYYW